jgi:DNA topoisomerase I
MRHSRLRYCSDNEPGIRRMRAGRGFRYESPSGGKPSARDLARIRALAIPPAYQDVWICRDPSGHLQATGRDARGRKQYRYHADWSSLRDEVKFERMIAFGEALPRIRKRVSADLNRKDVSREKVLATIVYLLEHVLIRIGNDEYARANDSYGLTTLEDKHVKTRGETVCLRFRGKSGVLHECGIRDRRVAKGIRACQELPGQRVFEYLDDAGEVRHVDSSEVNEYIRSIAGDEFSAKDFRTWAGTVSCCALLQKVEVPANERDAKQSVNEAIKAVARRLGNTVAVCRRSYVHPAIVNAFRNGSLQSSGSSETEALRVISR